MRAATGQTGDRAARAADSPKLLTTIRTAIDEPRGVSSRRKRQIVTALLIANPKVTASLPPFNAMRQNPAPTRTKLREDMRQFVLQSSLDFGWMMNELGIQRDQFGAIIGSPGGRLET